MRLEKMEIVSFGRCRECTLVPDGAGRVFLPSGFPGDTVFSFFLYLWYGEVPSSVSAGEAAGGCVLATASGGRLSLTRQGGENARLCEEASGKTWESEAPGEDIFGVSAAVFRQTVFFPGYGEDGAPEKELSVQSERLSSSGAVNEDINAGCGALSAVLARLSAEAGSGGAYALLAAECEKKEREFALAKAHRAGILARENQLFRNSNRQKEAEAELDKFKRLESDFRYACMIREYDTLHQMELEEDQKEKEADLYRRAHGYEGFTPDVSFLAELAEKKHALDAAEAAASSAAELYAAEKVKTDPLNEKEIRMVEIFSRTDGEEALALCRKAKKKKTLCQVLFALLCLLFLPLAAGFVFLLVREEVTAALLFATFAAFAVVGGALALYERHVALMRRSYLLMSCLATDEAELEANIALARQAAARRAAQAAKKRDAEIDFYCREEERSAAYEALSAVAARWGRSLRRMGGAGPAVEAISREAGTYIRESNALNIAKTEASEKVYALRQKLNASSEVAVRARIAPEARLKLCNLNETDLRRGVEHYEQLAAEYAEKGRMLKAEAASDGEGTDPVKVREEISLLRDRMEALAAKREICAAALAHLTANRASREADVAAKDHETQPPLLRLVSERIAVCRRTYSDMPPLFFAAKPLHAVQETWEKAGVREVGQCLFPVFSGRETATK